MRKPIVLLIPVAIVAASTLYPAGEKGTTSSSKSNPPEAYTAYCSSCHGADGQDFVGRDWKLGSDSESINRAITDGFELLGMPAFDGVLTEEELHSIQDYLGERASSEGDFRPSPPQTVQASDLTIGVHEIINGLETPWGMDFINDSTLLITEREGRLWKFESGVLSEIAGLPSDIHVKGQGGLLDVMHWSDPNDGSQWIYLTYSKNHPDDDDLSATALVRAPWDATASTITNWEELFVAEPYESTHRHYGSRVAIGGDGKMYLTCGERGMRDVHPQTLETAPGKVHRFNPDGTIPADNPFVNTPGAVPSIWSWGHRNPQGMIIHPISGEVWTHEHGPKGGDEINISRRGKNYGWPKITFGRNYIGTIITRDTAMTGLEQPLHYWLPSIGPCGMQMIHGGAWPETWQGNLLVGSLSFEYLERLQISNETVVSRERLLDGIGRVRDIVQNESGEIFVAVEGAGTILHLEPILEE